MKWMDGRTDGLTGDRWTDVGMDGLMDEINERKKSAQVYYTMNDWNKWMTERLHERRHLGMNEGRNEETSDDGIK